MKKLLILLMLSCAASTAHAFVYPTLEQVATKLYANYDVRELEDKERIMYQKKRDGWHVAYAVYSDTTQRYEVKKSQLYWSSETGKYKSLSMFPQGMTTYFSGRVSSDVRRAATYDFSRCPYYGYDGWQRDVIREFSTYTGPNDTIYEAVARAYSSYALGFTEHTYGFYESFQREFPEKQRIDSFIANEKKSIAVYDGMRKRNPKFIVLIGAVYTKYCNEIMGTYDELLYYGRESEISSYFNEELYDPLMRNIALNMLESCETNGIIFTNGDNDSYPLWYLQWIKGIRTDVAVMNSGLMNNAHYLERFRKGHKKAPAIKFGIPDSTYEREDYFMRGEGSSKRKMTGEGFLSSVYSENKRGDVTNYFPPGKFIIRRAKGSFANYDLISDADSAIINLEYYSYLSQSQMAILDIIISNHESRPIYIGVGMTVPGYLEDYCYLEGMVRRFIPTTEKLNDAEMRWLGPIASSTITQKNMSKLLSGDTTFIDSVNARRWESNIKLGAMYGAEMLLSSDKAGAAKLLNQLYAFYPLTSGRMKPLDCYALDVYYKSGDVKSGDALASALLDHIETRLAYLETQIPLSEDDRNEKSRVNSALTISKEAFRMHNRPALTSRAEKIDDKY